jgi:hypothetical protein
MPANTVLILGAGSSCFYGYPVGSELRSMIIALGAEQLGNYVSEGGSHTPREFLRDFEQSRMRSIDAFLARRGEYTHVGKAAIAAVLLKCEIEPIPQQKGTADPWYDYLINVLCQVDWDKLDFSWLSVVTFNYDRSFEWALFQALQAVYGKSPEEVAERLSSLSIHHVYGCLGRPWGDPSDQAYLAFGHANAGGPKFQIAVQRAAHHLRVIPEGRDTDQGLRGIQQIIMDATQVAFLGFSFDQTNLRRLGAPHSFVSGITAKRAVATTIGMTEAEVEQAQSRLIGEQFGRSRYGGRPVEQNHTFEQRRCEQLLRETLFLEE